MFSLERDERRPEGLVMDYFVMFVVLVFAATVSWSGTDDAPGSPPAR
jgi:hypothetical protein